MYSLSNLNEDQIFNVYSRIEFNNDCLNGHTDDEIQYNIKWKLGINNTINVIVDQHKLSSLKYNINESLDIDFVSIDKKKYLQNKIPSLCIKYILRSKNIRLWYEVLSLRQ